MNLTLIINGIIALTKLVPQLINFYDLFTGKWIDYKIKQIDIKLITHRDKRAALLGAIKGAKTNEERKALSILLHDFNIRKLSNSKRSTNS